LELILFYLGIKLETVNETAEKEEDYIEPYELQIKTECEGK